MIKRIIRKLQRLYYKHTGQLIKAYRKDGMVIGHDCCIYSTEFFGESYLLSIGNHVQITSGVKLFTHGGGWLFRDIEHNYDSFGKIQIGDNVYIGNNAMILPGITIGNNVLIAAGSIVTKNVPNNVVVAGNPAKIIESIDSYYKKNIKFNVNCKNLSATEKRDYLLSLPEDRFIRCMKWLDVVQ